MAELLGVGIATLDLIYEVDHHPAEDEELRALAFHRRRGGNVTNTLVVLAQLGHGCHWAGLLPQEPDAEVVQADLEGHGIALDWVQRPHRGKLPLSTILLGRTTGSRTIVHYRDLPEYPFEAFDTIDLNAFDWLHFEGRPGDELAPMVHKAARLGRPFSLEIEKPRPGIEALLPLPTIRLFSRAYAQSQGYEAPEPFLEGLPPGESYLAWGAAGGWCRDAEGGLHHRPAPPVTAVDTIGAGDTFNAGVLHGRLTGRPPAEALDLAVRLAAAKCARHGFDGLGELR